LNNLDLARINQEAPYKVQQLKKPGYFNFIDRGKFVMLQSSIIDREGVDNFFAIITRNDNPQAKQAISEFYDNVYFFNHKPE